MYFEWKFVFVILVIILTTGFTSSGIPSNVIFFLLSLPGYYVIAVDLRYNRGSWRHNVINTMLPVSYTHLGDACALKTYVEPFRHV